ncbi:MAG: pantoate--beta-alanine ligase [Flavobacteriaceae bacterium]|jgi:pantoate--beta-alanine ligase|nr:pantoate--beta-alanine ligase [Flavobacteriaceae bacterium]MCO4854363.1 pantoate--beta-alanine ligase [Flavobacteriaceae bacterium]MDA9368689.1 pantoate--beta-alanine ligase [Flavobacteriaceae bacterium]MDB4032066.1 pantoate--beta-alanine ligase [Flavobacteriaceae bacterium]MDB4171984.1 pantoate--beta-alanine ligase [Flavobacteriaceae bacterium]|tara:strand:+ start:57 stop:905 length:849 start_codon:yes stop_codon:yes gene_type:complete
MDVFNSVKSLNERLSFSREQGNSLGLVPTMGALHNGHLSLVAKAVRENNTVVVSIFVNPTQFNNAQDLAQYPQQLTADIALLKTISEDLLVFTPSVKEMYPEGLGAKPYSFNGLDRRWEGEDRPGHFQGVGTVVEKLFEMVRPNQAYFGEKDFQQLAIIRDLVRQKAFGISIVGCPIVRESYGLAMSSRNERLKPLDRVAAAVIYKTLKIAAQKALAQNLLSEITHEAIKEIHALENTAVFYFEFVNARSLEPIKTLENPENTRIITAVNFKGVRLLDNIGL